MERMSLTVLQSKIGTDCTRCTLQEHRTKVVFGDGPQTAKIMMVGEAPGRDEDIQGRPFVGASGKRLDSWLAALAIPRSAIYITNICKCRPISNRDPEPDEIGTCSPFLTEEIEIIRPKLIFALGRFSAQFMSRSSDPMKELRTRVLTYQGNGFTIPLKAIYHPAYVLREERFGNKNINAQAIEDITMGLRQAQPSPAPGP